MIDQPVRRLTGIILILSIVLLLLAVIILQAGQTQAASSTPKIAARTEQQLVPGVSGIGSALSTQTAPEPDSAGSADWPMPNYDNGRTRANLLETNLTPAFPVTPTKELTYRAGENFRPAPVQANDMLFWYSEYSTGGEELVVATDLDGQKVWSFDVPAGHTLWSAPPVVAGNEVFLAEIGSDDEGNQVSNVVALDRQTGSLLWRKPAYANSQFEDRWDLPIIAREGVAYFSWVDPNTANGYLTAVNSRTGDQAWESPAIYGADTLAVTNDVLVMLTFTEIVGYDLFSGDELWTFDVADATGEVFQIDDILAVGGKIALINEWIVAVLDAANGSILWSLDIDNVACVHGGRMVMASDGDILSIMGLCGDQLRTYDLDTGIELWRKITHQNSGEFNVAMANGFVYISNFDQEGDFGDWTGYIAAYNLIVGTQVQRIDVNTFFPGIFEVVEDLVVANGQLMVTLDREEPLFFWDSAGNSYSDYLPLYNEDESPDTNPDNSAQVSIIDRDGVYGAEIQVAARIGGLSATLKVYHAGGGLYKEGSAEPDEFGNGFWIAPLEYMAAGYEYQVILGDGTELPMRQILMPEDPAANVTHEFQTDSLSWVSPPITVTMAPYTLTLALPVDFPQITTTISAMFQSAEKGIFIIDGARVGDKILIRLDQNVAVNGTFSVMAVALAGNLTAFSPGLPIVLENPIFPDVRARQINAYQSNADGSVTGVTYTFERQRPEFDNTKQADVQIADIRPNLSGYQVLLWIKTPPEDPLNPDTAVWGIGLAAFDSSNNELDRVIKEIPASPEGLFMTVEVDQPGKERITKLVTMSSNLGGNYNSGFNKSMKNSYPKISSQSVLTSPLETYSDLSCQTDIAADYPTPSGYTALIDSFNILVHVQAANQYAEATSGVRWQVETQNSFFVNKHCIATPLVKYPLAGPIRFTDYKSPATGGRQLKLDDLVIEDHQINNYRHIVLGGEEYYRDLYITCSSSDDCGFGNDPANKPSPPGNDHPDDTLSVVVRNGTHEGKLNYWQNVFTYANHQGFIELADYARYWLKELAFIATISDIPSGVALTEEQSEIINANEAQRVFATAELQEKWGTIAAQLEQMEADQANVLANGYYQEMQAMLSDYGIPSRLVGPDFSPDSLSGSMIVIPTAGLYGLENDAVFGQRLERIVAQGGTLLVMTQPGDDALDLLPGDWDQVDYQQDQSCWVDAMTLVEFHPILASISEPTFTSHVDGFMTTIPNSAQLLLERTKNQQGALVFYEYGQGRMIVTNMYDDWGRAVGQSSQQVRELFRDIARWASIGDVNLPEILPGQAVQLDVDVTNVISETTAKVEWLVRDPNGVEVESGLSIQDLALTPGQISPQSVGFTPGGGALGIWYLNYQLLDSVDEVLQGETQAGYFIVKNPPAFDLAPDQAAVVIPYTPGATDIDANLSLDQAAYQPGEIVSATLAISLSDPGAVSGLKAIVSLGETTEEQLLPAVANQQVSFNLPADFDGNGLLFYGVYESTAGQGLYLNTQWVQPAGDSVTIVPAAPSYTPGETVTVNISGDYTRTIFVDAVDFARTLDVSGTTTATVDLPEVLSSGPVQVHYFDGGRQRSARFDIIGPRVTVKDMDTNEPLIAPGAQAEVYATIESDQQLNVLIAGEIVDGDSFRFPTVYMTTTLVPGQQTLTMTMPISTSTSGSVRYQMEIFDATKTAVSYVQAHRFFTIDAPALQAVRAAGGPTTPGNKPQVSLDWYAPSAAELEVVLWLDGTAVVTQTVYLPGGFTTTDLTIPGELAHGVYELYAEAEVGEGITTSVHGTLTVEEAGLNAIYLPMVTR